MKTTYTHIETSNAPIKAWVNGVLFEEEAKQQLQKLATLPFIYKWIAVMPDVHAGRGSTIGTVIPTIKAIVPATVGVDIGCGMMACKTSLSASQLPDNLYKLRLAIEKKIPHGSNPKRKIGQWNDIPIDVAERWVNHLEHGFISICDKYPRIKNSNNIAHLGTLGGGNHFVEVCLDEANQVWLMLHSGSRGVGNLIGTYFIELAKKEMERCLINLPDKDMAYLPEGSIYFNDYMDALFWAQRFAQINREIMMSNLIIAVKQTLGIEFDASLMAVNCHHNYVNMENHFGQDVYVTRKGAVSAKKGELGIIPGSMGAKSFIVRGLGNKESFHSCSHGAGRRMSRTKAQKIISLTEHANALQDVECRIDSSTIDETPAAYKDIDKVMAAQNDLVEIVFTLKQIVCVKG